MILMQNASAGTAEGSDVIVRIEKQEKKLEIEIESVVKSVFGRAIEETVSEMLGKFDITSGKIYIYDQGALDCTIRARMETAILRAGKEVSV